MAIKRLLIMHQNVELKQLLSNLLEEIFKKFLSEKIIFNSITISNENVF